MWDLWEIQAMISLIYGLKSPGTYFGSPLIYGLKTWGTYFGLRLMQKIKLKNKNKGQKKI